MNEIKRIMPLFQQLQVTPEEAKEHDARVQKMLEESEREAKKERYKKSGVPERYLAESLDTYKITNDMQRKASQAAINYLGGIIQGHFRTLVMLGTPGTGKTHLACAVIREYGGKYRTAPDIVEEIRRAKSFSADRTEKQIIDFYSCCQLLAIDEIGRGIAATDEKYMLYQIINARYNTRKPTVLISNYKKADFLKYIGVAAADRLVESAEILEMDGESYRKAKRQNESTVSAV